ncbi:molecular chaperone HtpG [Tistlia consotensis]|uniref:Chaperone protein HtpG n=1 Tax=Tistlia consotensis USBA 355 TaxID=560819 RepID=A0A1Y6CPD1_9PROT|nr:molecular chaperone HtpG [Tistlia consotensis]SMF78896.1 molecular chaperone HtpG [Tistlia consotensis USBA 355]SNS15128.1 molecular chaperone HtpG [Tistlia consotensis]
MTEETLSFQAEVSRLLDIVANALYSQDEVFLRELVSNASDACDRLRYAAISEPHLLGEDPELAIEIAPDKEAATLTVADNGIGMNREELIENLGTIARSGTAAFVQALGEKKGEVEQIGQFGVGFYAAFMVADKVEVLTRKAGDEQGWHWVSDGKGSFTVGEAGSGESAEAPARGTRIVLHLKADKREYLEPHRLRHVVKTYSDHIAVPVRLREGGKDPETLNSAGALWTRPKSEITDEQYQEFYHHVAHAADEPWARLHFKAEGTIEYSGLLFVPGARPFDLFDPQRKSRVKLYVKRVFITDDCEGLVPSYLRFLRGIVDSEDLPLNISREMVQHHPVLQKIRQAVTKRVIGELEAKAEKDGEGYETFWENFGAVLKEGLYEADGQREALLKLARFRSTAVEGWTSLADYVGRMKPGQKAIFTIAGDDAEKLKRSPQLEGFRAKGVEVLLLTDPVDEFWPNAVHAFEDKPFRSVTRGGAELDEIEAEATEGEDKKDEAKEPEAGPETATLLAFLKQTLDGKVKDVRLSQRLTESAVCLVADEGDLDLHLAKLLKQHQQLDEIAPRVLEINARHALIRQLGERLQAGNGAAEALEPYAFLLLDQARILEGEAPLDPAAFARRMSELATKTLG